MDSTPLTDTREQKPYHDEIHNRTTAYGRAPVRRADSASEPHPWRQVVLVHQAPQFLDGLNGHLS